MRLPVPSFTRRIARSAIPFVSERWGVAVRWFHENSSQELPNSQKKSVWMTFGFCDGSRNFRRLCSVSSEFLFLHGQDCIHWVARSCTTTAYRWLFRDSRPSMRTLCSAVYQVTILFCSQNGSLSFFAGVSLNTMLPFNRAVSASLRSSRWCEWCASRWCESSPKQNNNNASVFWCLHVWSSTFPNLSSLFQRNVRAHVSKSSRLIVKGCNQTGMPCVGSSLSMSSFLCAEPTVCPGLPCQDLSASVSRMHACHFELSLDLTMFSGICWLIFWSWCRSRAAAGKMMAILVQRDGT